MAKLYVSLTPEEVRASIPYDLICMVRYGQYIITYNGKSYILH